MYILLWNGNDPLLAIGPDCIKYNINYTYLLDK